MSALQYGWNGPKEEKDSFWVSFSPCTREPKSWKEEIYSAARLIAEKAGKPVWVCFSGGIDSEIVCRAFFDQGIHFSVIAFEHVAGTNEHDIKFAKKWCTNRGISYNSVPIDMLALMRTGIEEYAAQSYISEHVFRYFQIKMLETVESMGGYAVLGSGEQTYAVEPKKPSLSYNDVFLDFNSGKAVPFEWCRRNNTSHQPSFFTSTPELCLSYLRTPLVDFMLHNPDLFRHPANTYTAKRLVYQSEWSDIEARYKYDGFEKIRQPARGAMQRLREIFGDALQTYRLPVSAFASGLAPHPAPAKAQV